MAERILVVDDELSIRDVLALKLESSGFDPVTAASAIEALEYLRREQFDLVISDINMPGMDGITMVREVKKIDPTMLVILVTALSQSDYVIRALKAGAYDYIVKPFRLDDMQMAVQRALERTRLMKENEEYRRELETKVAERTAELELRNHQLKALFLNTIESLVLALEAKDSYTEGHSRRVTRYAVEIAREMGLSEDRVHDVELAAMLHDIGKIGVREEILLKPGRLTADEYNHIMKHPVIGAYILEPIDMLHPAIGGVRHHHERYDGEGRPDGLAGEQIPLVARILACADTYDAMTSTRPYRRARSVPEALLEIRRCSGSQFDPVVVEAFLRILERSGPGGIVEPDSAEMAIAEVVTQGLAD